MATDVREVHIQDLADVIGTEYPPTDLADVFRRFELPADVVQAAESDVPEGLRRLSGTESLRPVLAHIVENATWSPDQRTSLEAAFAGSPLSVRETEEGGLELHQRIVGAAERTVGDKRAYFEEEGPSVILTQIEAAEANFGQGDYDLAAAEIRRALDMLVVAGFEEALEELAEAEYISLGDEHEHSDATLLYVTYGYCSFLGADPQAKGFETSRLQAELALVLGEEVLYFLLQTMAAAEADGVDLSYWERP
jgi:hypothetical protein